MIKRLSAKRANKSAGTLPNPLLLFNLISSRDKRRFIGTLAFERKGRPFFNLPNFRSSRLSSHFRSNRITKATQREARISRRFFVLRKNLISNLIFPVRLISDFFIVSNVYSQVPFSFVIQAIRFCILTREINRAEVYDILIESIIFDQWWTNNESFVWKIRY